MIGGKNIMGESTLPVGSLNHHRQNKVQELFKGKEGNGSPTDHINHQKNFSQSAAMSEVAELTWKNGKLATNEYPTKTAWENQEEERETTMETGCSSSARRRGAAEVHNQSKRRRRDRIYQKMKALQKLVPNASKTDKALMLDQVIDYLIHLQVQFHMFNRYMQQPQFMMPLGMHQHIQMSLLARMGLGMGMLDMSRMVCSAAIPPPMSTLVHPNPGILDINCLTDTWHKDMSNITSSNS